MIDVTKLGFPWVDYRRLDYYRQRHHARFKRFVEGRRLVCMECKGRGGETESILDDGSGPWEECGWCEGTGYMTPGGRGLWLTYKKEDKRERELRRAATAATKEK